MSVVCSMESIGIDDCFVLPLNFDSFCAQVFIFVEVDISLNADEPPGSVCSEFADFPAN